MHWRVPLGQGVSGAACQHLKHLLKAHGPAAMRPQERAARPPCPRRTLRGLLEFKLDREPVPLEEVEEVIARAAETLAADVDTCWPPCAAAIRSRGERALARARSAALRVSASAATRVWAAPRRGP